MPREKEAYRDNLVALMEYFGEKRLLTARDVARYCGRDYRYVQKLYQIGKGGITLPTLARKMS